MIPLAPSLNGRIDAHLNARTGRDTKKGYTLRNHIREVAQSWEASADAKQWAVKIRKSMLSHNRKAVRPEGVIASVDCHRFEGSASVGSALVEQIVEMRVDGQTWSSTLRRAMPNDGCWTAVG
ncbi:hypothetical protein [Roseovarius sp. Pro17]|uniref:hypothetical protein n=1 Tax=Roseovarius sp. Pro17 TaxID=3108175 RepID=UPI002D78D938|nr:hypothetical protein [Roseovarius sp. Pro17]